MAAPAPQPPAAPPAALPLGSADLTSEAALRRACDHLIASSPGGLRSESQPSARLRAALDAGRDPLGEAFTRLRTAAARRPLGATYTPAPLVDAMVAWARARPGPPPARVIDPGAGSARFLLAAGRAFPAAELVGVEIDPLAAAVARANLHAAGLSGRARIVEADFRQVALEPAASPTLYIGNPPYVRHHDIEPRWKEWLAAGARRRDLPPSRLAGLHIHFLLAIAERARPGDRGVLVTAAEWLDVNYGRLARALLAGELGLRRLDVLDAALEPFPDAQSTAAIACFEVAGGGADDGEVALRRVRRLAELAPLAGGRAVQRDDLRTSMRWSDLADAPPPPRRRARPAGLVELGELCRVHRGQVTGANKIWIAGPDHPPLPPALLVPAVTRAAELLAAAPRLEHTCHLRRVIDLPGELDALEAADRRLVERFLRWARDRGGHLGYVARHRTPWWSVRLAPPAPILATYMARRPPAFARNPAGARHINIAHGLHPRAPMDGAALDALADALADAAASARGRTYAGGLLKLEPGEMERLLIAWPPE